MNEAIIEAVKKYPLIEAAFLDGTNLYLVAAGSVSPHLAGPGVLELDVYAVAAALDRDLTGLDLDIRVWNRQSRPVADLDLNRWARRLL